MHCAISLSSICVHLQVDDRAKFQKGIAGSRNLYVVSLTFISSLLTKTHFNGTRRFCWFSRCKIYLLYKIIYLRFFIFNCDFISSFLPFVFRINLERKNTYLAMCVPSIRYAFTSFTARYRSCEIRALWYYQKSTKSSMYDFSFTIYGPLTVPWNLEKWIALSLLGLISQTSSTRWIA